MTYEWENFYQNISSHGNKTFYWLYQTKKLYKKL